MKLGFIGTGALTSAIVTGLRSLPDVDVPVVLSPRNADIAAGLASRFADVRMARDNQAVLDGLRHGHAGGPAAGGARRAV